jgi:simple sugar transport system permease protein
MEQWLSAFGPELVRSGIRLATPIILAALGGALCNKAGVLNLALEGKMLLGSFVGILAAYYFHNSYLGVLAAAVSGALVGLIFAFLYLRYNVNLIILAIAVNLFIAEMTVFFMRTFLGDVGTWSDPSVKQLPDVPIPLIQNVPRLGEILSSHNWIVYSSWIAVILAFVILYYTVFGRNIRAVGEAKAAAESVGISVARVQVFVLVTAGVLCGMAGAFLSVGHLTLFTRNMSNGRGWIAVTAALFGFNHPIGVFLTGMFFGFADAFAIRLQTTTDIPPSLVQFIPHVLTLIALVLVGARAVFFEYLARRRFRQKAKREIAAHELASAD